MTKALAHNVLKAAGIRQPFFRRRTETGEENGLFSSPVSYLKDFFDRLFSFHHLALIEICTLGQNKVRKGGVSFDPQ